MPLFSGEVLDADLGVFGIAPFSAPILKMLDSLGPGRQPALAPGVTGRSYLLMDAGTRRRTLRSQMRFDRGAQMGRWGPGRWMRGRSMLAAAVLLGGVLGACGAAGWSAEDRQRLASELCAQEFGVGATSADCRCIVEATVDSYSSAGEFTQSDAPSPAYRAALRDCGFALVPQ